MYLVFITIEWQQTNKGLEEEKKEAQQGNLDLHI